jgi:CRISPR/Cas system-associated protein Cas10 (large subunit of type III CRISPR-Cas system)
MANNTSIEFIVDALVETLKNDGYTLEEVLSAAEVDDAEEFAAHTGIFLEEMYEDEEDEQEDEDTCGVCGRDLDEDGTCEFCDWDCAKMEVKE